MEKNMEIGTATVPSSVIPRARFLGKYAPGPKQLPSITLTLI